MDNQKKNNQLKILVVEDDRPLNKLIRKNLQRSGYQTEVAYSGKEAVEKILAQQNFVVILDYNLPDCKARDVILELTQKNLFLPYIVITGSGDIKNSVEMMKMGARDYLIKDLNFLTMLPAVVKKVVDQLSTKQKLAETEKALSESEEQITIFKSFAQASGQSFSIAKFNGKYTYVNPAFRELIQIDKSEDIFNEEFYDIYPPQQRQQLIDNILPEVKSTGQWTGELTVLTKKKQLIDTIQNIFILKDSKNVPRYFANVITDITERKRAEEMLNLQSTTLEASANSIMITNNQGDIVWVNPAFTALTGYKKNEILYKNINMLRSLKQTSEFYDNIWIKINNGEVWHGEIINQRKNGENYFEEQTITPVFNHKNEITNFIAVKQDITQRKKIESELKQMNEELEEMVRDRTKELLEANDALLQSEQKFRSLFEYSSDAVMLMDNKGYYDCNSATLKVFGCASKDQFLSKTILDFSPEYQPDNNRSDIMISKYISEAEKNGSARFEWRHIHLDGSEFYADTWLTMMYLGGRKVIQAVVRDITNIKRAEEKLREAEVQLREAEKMAALGELVAGVAHEINTPVGIGVTAASYLDTKTRELAEVFEHGKLKKSDLQNYLGTAENASKSILSNLKRAANLVKSFKQVAVDQANQEDRIFNIKEYINEVILSLKPQLKKTSHIIEIECGDELEIRSSPGAFAQILTNFIMNSLKHGFDKQINGVIKIQFYIEYDKLVFIYSDNGKGIPQSHIKKVFDPFFTTKRAKGGTGLGLNIVYNIVTQKLSGTISCNSNNKKGVVFEIRIPLVN